MKTCYFALALLGPIAAAAQTAPPLTVYGALDAGLELEGGCKADCAHSRLNSGIESGSRLGVKGGEPLDGDLSAVFTLEAGILNDRGASDQNGRLFGRQAFVGLDSRSLGALTLGRQYNLNYLALTEVADPFRGGLAGSAGNLIGYTVMRYDNAIKYVTPTKHGLTASAIYSFGEAPSSTASNRAYGAMLGYADGPVNLSLAYQRKNDPLGVAGVVPEADLSASNALVAANFNLGGATAYAAFGRDRGQGSSQWDASNPYSAVALTTPATDSRDVLVGVAVPRGALTFMASYIRKDDRSGLDQDADQFALGLSYAMSRRTDLYLSLARIHNKHGAPYTVGNASDPGHGDRAINIGLRHGF